ncbi:unnamed protein product [Closterium sp. NIES-54]
MGTAGRGCEGVADVPQQQQLPPRNSSLSPCRTLCWEGGRSLEVQGEAGGDLQHQPPPPPVSPPSLGGEGLWSSSGGEGICSTSPPRPPLLLPPPTACAAVGGRGSAAPTPPHQPPPAPPFSYLPLLWVQQWGGGDLQHQPPPSPPFSFIPFAPRALLSCCPVRPERPAALRAPRAPLSCCPAHLARPAALRAPRALLPCSPVRPAALQPYAPYCPAALCGPRALQPCAPRAPCCPAALQPCAPCCPAALCALSALQPCAPRAPCCPATPRALLPCSPVRPAALQPCAPCCPAALCALLPCCPVRPARPAALRAPCILRPCCAPRALLPCCPAAAVTALAVAATALSAAPAPPPPLSPPSPCCGLQHQPPPSLVPSLSFSLSRSFSLFPVRPAALQPCAPCCPAAAATALAVAATALAAALHALLSCCPACPARTAALRAPLALLPCAPCCPVRPVRPAALCTRHAQPPPLPAPPSPPPFLLHPLLQVQQWGEGMGVPAPAPPPLPSLRPAPTVTTAPALGATGPATAATAIATATTAAPTSYIAMASLRVLEFDHEGRPVQMTRASTAPPNTNDSSTRYEWLTRDAAARLAIRDHLPIAECAHFGQHRTAQALYDAVVARYSSPATAALGRLLLPYLFPKLSAFLTVADLVSHLRVSDARYRAAVLAEFLDRNPPPMFITLYFIVIRLPNSLRSVRDHFLSLDPTSLTVDLLEQHLLEAETSAVAIGAARGTARPPFFEGCSPSPLAPSYASAADVSVAEDVGAASASAKRRNSKGKGGRGGGSGSGGGGGGSGRGGGGSSGGGGGGGTVGGSGGFGGGGGGSGGGGGTGGGGTGGDGTGAWRVGSGGGQRQQQQRRSETLSPQQLREWFLRGASRGSCRYVICTGDRAGQTCGRLHTQHCCFSRLDDAWRAEFGDDVELPRWADLLKSRIAIFDLDFDAILSAMYALSTSVEGDCYRCVPPDQGIAAAALGASESGTLPGTTPAEALHTFTLDSSASRCFFRDSTTLTRLPASVTVRLADPSGGLVVARSSTILPCPAVPSGSLSGLHLPSFSTNLVSTAALQDAMVTTTTPGGQRVSICTCTRTGRHLATFTRRLGSSLYTLATEPPQVIASAQVSAWDQVAASCSCRLLSHQTLLWHHRLGHPSLPRLRGMHSRLLGRQHAAPHSSSFPPTTAPLQTLHMDVWGPARVSGQSRECYFLLVVDDYTRYITVFPLRTKGQVVDVLIPWIRTVRLQLRERFGQDLPVLRLHSDRGGDFSSTLLRDFCRGDGILQSFTLPDSPQQNGIAERHIGLVMEVARTSMIHAAPRVSLPETSPTLRWTGELGDASVFRVWGSRAFIRDPSADKLSPRAIPCVFLGIVPDAPGWQYYHPTSRRVFPSQDVTFDESVPFYRLFPYGSAPPPPPPLFLAPDPLPGPAPVQVAVGSGATRDAASGGAESGGEEPGGAETGGAEPGGVGTGGAEPEGVEPGGGALEGAESGGAEPQGAALSGGSAGALPRLSPQQLREWFVRRACLRSGATGAGGIGGAGAAGAGGTGVVAGAGGTGGAAATGPGGAPTRGTGAAGLGGVEGAGAGDHTESGATGAGGAEAGGAGVGGNGAGGAGAAGASVGGTRAARTRAVDPGAGGAGGTVRSRPYFAPLLQQVLGTPSSTGPTPPFVCPLPDQSQPLLEPASLLPAPSPYTEQSGGLTERCEPASRPVLPVCTARRSPRSRPSPVPGTHTMTLRPSSVPLCVPLPAPPTSSLPEVLDPEYDRARAASPTVSRLLATDVTDPSFESAAASALVAELLDFAAACRLDCATALVAESTSTSPPSVGGECALGTDVLEDRLEDFECLAAAVPRFASMLLAPEGDSDAPDIPTPRSYTEAITGTYVDEVPPLGVNIVDGMWIFRGVHYFQTFSPTPKMTTLRVLLHVAAQRVYKLHSLDFSTAFLQGSLHEEIWLRRPPGFTGTFPAGTKWSLRRPLYGLRQAPRGWHDTLRATLAALGFAPSTADLSLFLRTDTSLPPFYVLVYVDNLVFATADTEALTLVNSELQKRHTCTDLGELRSYLGLQITRDRARRTITLTQSHMVHQVLQRFGF